MTGAVALLGLVVWFPSRPKPSASPDLSYTGPSGWHETVATGPKVNTIPEAIRVCRDHKWIGYVRYQDLFGQNTDSCEFMRRVAEKEPK